MDSDVSGVGCLAVIGFVLIGFLWIGSSFANEQDQTCNVTNMDRSADQNGNSNYRVYTDCGVLANDDDWIRGKTDSADIWGQIHTGGRYTFHVVGWRIPVFSAFPNILTVTPANHPIMAPGGAR